MSTPRVNVSKADQLHGLKANMPADENEIAAISGEAEPIAAAEPPRERAASAAKPPKPAKQAAQRAEPPRQSR